MTESIIYGLRRRNSNEGIRYVGSTASSLDERLKMHFMHIDTGRSLPLQQWLQNIAHDEIEIYELERVSTDIRFAVEREWIVNLNLANSKKLLNVIWTSNFAERLRGPKSDEHKKNIATARSKVPRPEITHRLKHIARAHIDADCPFCISENSNIAIKQAAAVKEWLAAERMWTDTRDQAIKDWLSAENEWKRTDAAKLRPIKCDKCGKICKGPRGLSAHRQRANCGDNMWKWLESTEQLQIEAYGNDLRNASGADRDRLLLENHSAIVWELTELMDETSAKPWSKETGVLNKEAYLTEAVDVAHFLANLLLLADVSEEEFWAAYREKQKRNWSRMSRSDGYDARKNRCPNCKRELDAPGAYRQYSIELKPATDDEPEYFEATLTCLKCRERFTYSLKNGEKLP